MRAFSIAVFCAAIGVAGAAHAKNADVSFPLLIGEGITAESSFNAHQPDADAKPIPSNVVFRQEAHVAGAVRLAAPITLNTENAGQISVASGLTFVAAKAGGADVYCRAFSQTAKGKNQYDHAGLCLRDSDSNGSFDQVLQAPKGKIYSVFDIKQVGKSRALPPVAYTPLAGDALPRADVVIKFNVNYGMGVGAAPPPVSLSFTTVLATPDEFLTENWGSRNWPLLALNPKASDGVAPETDTMSVQKPKPLTLGPYTINAKPSRETVAVEFEGKAAPGVYLLGGRSDILGYGLWDRRRLFIAKPAPGAGGGS
jgi:hypothetical protein